MARVTRRNLRRGEGWPRVIPAGSFLRVSNSPEIKNEYSWGDISALSALQWAPAPTTLQTLKLSFGEGGFQVEF